MWVRNLAANYLVIDTGGVRNNIWPKKFMDFNLRSPLKYPGKEYDDDELSLNEK